jgi:hypothetical protein
MSDGVRAINPWSKFSACQYGDILRFTPASMCDTLTTARGNYYPDHQL